MTDKFQNKYRISSSRLQNWDYGWNAAYFVTICTKNREPYFGEIANGKMILSSQGILADVFWHEIQNHANNVELDAFVVMPNHIHGILILNGEPPESPGPPESGRDEACLVSTSSSSGSPETIGQKRFQNQGINTLSSIIGSYKSAITKHANRLRLDFAWQSRYHDHIIRDNASFIRIRNYIINNPANWHEDKFYN